MRVHVLDNKEIEEIKELIGKSNTGEWNDKTIKCLIATIRDHDNLLKKYGHIVRLAIEYVNSEQDTIESSTKKLALILAVNDLEEE